MTDKSENTKPRPDPSRPAPTPLPLDQAKGQDYDVQWLDAKTMKLSQLLGQKKVVVINFWATWCGPCRREIPELIALQNDYKGKDVEIVGLSVENPQQATELVKQFSERFSINYKVGFSPTEMFITFNGTDPRAPIPQTFIFGRDGQLVQHIKGMRPYFREFVAQTVDQALKTS